MKNKINTIQKEVEDSNLKPYITFTLGKQGLEVNRVLFVEANKPLSFSQ